jgi:hypothetical protein
MARRGLPLVSFTAGHALEGHSVRLNFSRVGSAIPEFDSTRAQALVAAFGPSPGTESERLEAIPWTPYCLKHERERRGPRNG